MGSTEANPDTRLSFQETMELVELPTEHTAGKDNKSVKRYMGTRAAWLPGIDLAVNVQSIRGGKPIGPVHKAAYGGQVYAQSMVAIYRAMVDQQKSMGGKSSAKLGFHTMHGFFTAQGLTDRPFIYAVTPMTSSRSFSTLSVTAHQPALPSTNPTGDHFPTADAHLPAGSTCFTAIASFKSGEPHTGSGTVDAAESPVQERFASILSSRPPEAWPPSPPVDIDMILDVVGKDIIGTFPAVDMKKVDMTAFNEGKPFHERRELLLYRLLKPLPDDGTDGWDANAHVIAHAFTVDRNGLLMAGNHLGIGRAFGRAASLSYSFVVHVNVEETVMKGDGWWVQEACFPRAGAGRTIVMSKIWSPEGVHVATEYQDGLAQAYEKSKGIDRRFEKL